jgi:hypothetical protein
MTDDSLSRQRNIFTATHSVFLHQIDQGSLPSTRSGFFPAYGWELGKIPTWREIFRHGGKNSDMVGKIPPWKWDMVGKIPS